MSVSSAKAEGQKPVKVFRSHGVKVAVFANPVVGNSTTSVFYKATVQRVYKVGEAFKTTTSLSRADLPIACYLLQRAFEFIVAADTVTSPP